MPHLLQEPRSTTGWQACPLRTSSAAWRPGAGRESRAGAGVPAEDRGPGKGCISVNTKGQGWGVLQALCR